MATPRSRLIDNQVALHYHLISRCVRRSWLCDRDPHTGKNYNHRKEWLTSRLLHLAQYFAVEVDAYTIMSNHFHLVLYYDPLACESWSETEVATRWSEAFPPRLIEPDAEELELRKAWLRDSLLASPEKLAAARRCLGSLSALMKHLKQPIAWRANREDNCTGHFFEGRFYSGALLGEAAVLAAMAYVDLNPVRARIARSIEQCRDSSVASRLLQNTPERLRAALVPLVSGLGTSEPRLSMTLGDYIDHCRMLTEEPKPGQGSDAQRLWFARVAAINKRQRAYGSVDELQDWVKRHGYKRLGTALPN